MLSQAPVYKLYELSTLVTNHMFMMFTIKDRLEMCMGICVANFPDDPGLDQQSQGPVNRTPADAVGSSGQVPSQIVGLEVVFPPQSMFQDNPPGLRNPVASGLEKNKKNLPSFWKKATYLIVFTRFFPRSVLLTRFAGLFLIFRFHLNFPTVQKCN